MSQLERQDAAGRFQILDSWREQTVEILHFTRNVSCKHILSYLDRVSRHSVDIELEVPEHARCCIHIWQPEQVSYLKSLATGCKRHAAVKWFIEAFGRDHYPTLCATRKHLNDAGLSYTMEEIRKYHRESFISKGYDDSISYILSYGPPMAYDVNGQQPNTGEATQLTTYSSEDGAEEIPASQGLSQQAAEVALLNQNQAMATVDNICEGSFVTVWNSYTRRSSEPIQVRLSTFDQANFISWAQLCRIGMENALVQDASLYTRHSDGTSTPAVGYVDLYYAFQRQDDPRSSPEYIPEPARFHVARELSHPFILGRHRGVGQLTRGFINVLPSDLQNQVLSYLGGGMLQLEAGRNAQRALTNGD